MTIAGDHGSGVLRREELRLARGQLVCLLATLHPERGLSRVLAQHLVQELPHVTFSLRPDVGRIHTVWLCGYEPGGADVLRRLRAQHPTSHLLVSGRHPIAHWAWEAEEAGADAVCAWPVSLDRLDVLLHGKRPR